MSRSPSEKPATRCLVLGYDGSDGARRAASWAASDLPPDGRLVLVRAGRPLHLPPSPLASADERAQVGHAIFDELMLDGDEALMDVQLTTEVSDEDPVTALLEAAQRHGATAIVLGCEQHSRLHRALGVVTSELLQRSPVPVISVPAGVDSQ
ncbi:MAG TPA: universal stress protein [Solirubrobacteraceae bacterium]